MSQDNALSNIGENAQSLENTEVKLKLSKYEIAFLEQDSDVEIDDIEMGELSDGVDSDVKDASMSEVDDTMLTSRKEFERGQETIDTIKKKLGTQMQMLEDDIAAKRYLRKRA